VSLIWRFASTPPLVLAYCHAFIVVVILGLSGCRGLLSAV
jgi:hypothetical protein